MNLAQTLEESVALSGKHLHRAASLGPVAQGLLQCTPGNGRGQSSHLSEY